MTDLVRCESSGHIATLTLNNPPLNLNSVAMTRAISDALDRVAVDSNIYVLIVTAVGEKAFCAGSDVKEFPRLYDDGNIIEGKLRFENETLTKLDRFPKATVGALNGLAYGGGLEIAACCDLLVAEEHVRLALPEIALGTFPGGGGTVRVPRRIGAARTKQLIFFGEPITAETALEWGLVDYVTPKGEGLRFARNLAEKLAQLPVNAIAHAKRSVDESSHLPNEIAIERVLNYSSAAFSHPNALEGMQAFVAKRRPAFNR